MVQMPTPGTTIPNGRRADPDISGAISGMLPAYELGRFDRPLAGKIPHPRDGGAVQKCLLELNQVTCWDVEDAVGGDLSRELRRHHHDVLKPI